VRSWPASRRDIPAFSRGRAAAILRNILSAFILDDGAAGAGQEHVVQRWTAQAHRRDFIAEFVQQALDQAGIEGPFGGPFCGACSLRRPRVGRQAQLAVAQGDFQAQ